MGSEPRPSSEGIAPLARPLSSHGGRSLGAAARRLSAAAAVGGTGLRRRLRGDDVVGAPPWGVWPPAPTSAPDAAAVARELGPAMAALAEQMWRKRGGDRPPPRRGLPLLARRRGDTALGANTGPGGLAHASVLEDHPQSRDVRTILERSGIPTDLHLRGGL